MSGTIECEREPSEDQTDGRARAIENRVGIDQLIDPEREFTELRGEIV